MALISPVQSARYSSACLAGEPTGQSASAGLKYKRWSAEMKMDQQGFSNSKVRRFLFCGLLFGMVGGAGLSVRAQGVNMPIVQTLRVGNYPTGLAFDGANIWVVNEGDNDVMKLRATDGALLGNF